MSEPPINRDDGDTMPRWYVVQCKGGESFRAAEHLSNQQFDVFHPVLQVQKKRRAKLIWVDEPLFPHYLFIRLRAVFEHHNGEERAIVLLDMLHKLQRLEIPIARLRRDG